MMKVTLKKHSNDWWFLLEWWFEVKLKMFIFHINQRQGGILFITKCF